MIHPCEYRDECRIYSHGDPNCLTSTGGSCHIPIYLRDRKKFSKVEHEARMIALNHVREIISGIEPEVLDSIELNDVGLVGRLDGRNH